MIDEKTTLKLKQIAKGLGLDWKIDFINSKDDYFIIKKGHHVELRLRKNRGTKFKFTAYLFLMKSAGNYYIPTALKYDQIQLSYSVDNIVNTLKGKVIPENIEQQILDMKKVLLRAEEDLHLHEYFIQSLSAFGPVKFPKHQADRFYFIDLNPDVEDKANKNIIDISRSTKDTYNLSTELSRDNIIKVIGFIKGLLENESRGT